ncbi:hypothetical protein COCSADRAFT_39757 [Bipolaris sorokiniana ND90Pr]|uniref:Uncharacterized protein n=1 Tax=Cochliobolus sativus (strain ND90Pr / ATCC 201652) TaxID=665912 RepID=M2S1D3_COCSN|nr:uncharacterized protein COCSADRAFT_39757 [Bipolaris sorokiniana ND90Pr]EMD61058.1 hypothetical protein COCSADRAFT_39757 [Bipolaris sorokiniana ND90Pr]
MPPHRNTATSPILPTHNQTLPANSQQASSDRSNRRHGRHKRKRAACWYKCGENVWRSRLDTASHVGICLAALMTLIFFLRRGDP